MATDWTKVFKQRVNGSLSVPQNTASPINPKANTLPQPVPVRPAGPGVDNIYGYQGAKPSNVTVTPDRSWFKGTLSNASVPNLARDPEQLTYQWARSQGYGRGVEGLLNSYVDPYAMSMITGADTTNDADYLAYAGGFNKAALAPTNGTAAFSAPDIVRRVLGSSGTLNADVTGKAQPPDRLGVLLYGGEAAMNPSAQVKNTLDFLKSSLTGVTSPVILNSYLSTLQDQGQAFLAYKNTPEGAKTPMNFGQFVIQTLGPNGGI